jgi:hypothetical protein
VDRISVDEGIPRSTLYAALKGDRLPGREVVAALVRSWGDDVTEWLVKRTAVEAELTRDRGAVSATPASPNDRKWQTIRTVRSVLVVVRNVTSLDRLLSVVSLLEADHRIQLIFTINEGSAFKHGLDEALDRLGVLAIPWPHVPHHRFDLALTSAVLPREVGIEGPVLVLPHGVGFESYALRGVPDDNNHFIVADEFSLDRLREQAPDLAERASIGDPYLDRLVVSLSQLTPYRRALGVDSRRKLVLLASTWGSSSLIAEHFDLVQQLLTQLPTDDYRICLVLHPNVWAAHGRLQIEAWLREALRQGLLLIPPLGGEQAALVGADMVIGDHGSVTSYAAALGHPVLRVADSTSSNTAQANPDARQSATYALLDPTHDLHRQVEAAIKATSTAAAYVHTPAAAAKSAEELSRTVYRLLELEMPAEQPQFAPVPVPTLPDRALHTHGPVLDRLARDVSLEIQEDLPSSMQVQHDSSTADEFATSRNIAANSPEGAVLVTWALIEKSMHEALSEFINIDRQPSSVMVGQLQRIGLGSQFARATDELRRIRNIVAHGTGGQISSTGALDYIDAAERAAGCLSAFVTQKRRLAQERATDSMGESVERRARNRREHI